MDLKISTKHLKIDKAQSTAIIVIVAASVVTIFCLISSKALISQANYQRRVLHARRDAVKKLNSNVTAANKLINYYNSVFEGNNPDNIIGGKNVTSAGAVPPDGDNARIVLDALPSKYDFPALITSVTNILNRDGITNPSIGSIDQSATIDSKPSVNPQSVIIQLTVSGSGNYGNIQTLVKDLERSIRPFDTVNVQISGSVTQMSISLNMNTYFQPAKTFTIEQKALR
jgi:hypothetical protein